MTTAEIRLADLTTAVDRGHVIDMIDAYSRDPMGGGTPLSDAIRAELERGLADEAAVRALLATQGDAVVGIAFCQRTFATFAAAPRLNLHDLSVVPEARGTGVGRILLEAVERLARDLGCSAVTLEVYEHNTRAQRIYAEAGFESLDAGRRTFFLKKDL